MEQISGYSRVLANIRVKQLINRPLFGKPHLKYGQSHALWSYFFQLGGILAAKYTRRLDAFGTAFLGAQGKPGAVKKFFSAAADRMIAEFPIDSMTFSDYVGTEFLGRVDYTGNPTTYLIQHGGDKISPDTSEEIAWQYSQQGAALGATYPEKIRHMFVRTHVTVPTKQSENAQAAGLNIPDQQDLLGYEETEGGEDQAFMEYCRTCCPTLYGILSSPSGRANHITTMTIERANEITDNIEAILANPQPIAGRFTPLSRTGASSRLEIAHALYIVTAQVFKAASKSQSHVAEFENFVRGAGSSLWHVLYLSPCFPDSELDLITKLDKSSVEFAKERKRLTELAVSELEQKDRSLALETVESFVSYLRTIDPDAGDYWANVYQRIGLECPADLCE